MCRFPKVIILAILSQSVATSTKAGDDFIFADGFEQCINEGGVHWDGGGNGESWSDPQNWVGDILPADNDDVTINVNGDSLLATWP